MINITHTEVVGFMPAIRGMRNPLNSWDKSDTDKFNYDIVGNAIDTDAGIVRPDIGDNDLSLMKKLSNAGTDHGKYLRFIQVYCDINAPLYWHKEMDTYRMGVEKNSCSTMHKIQEKEFTIDDFSHEHLNIVETVYDTLNFAHCSCGNHIPVSEEFAPYDVLDIVIKALNKCREKYLETKDKHWWWQMIQLLPSSYNQKRTYIFSYQALKNMYHARKNHKLDEWHTFCEWVEELPYSELITGEQSECN